MTQPLSAFLTREAKREHGHAPYDELLALPLSAFTGFDADALETLREQGVSRLADLQDELRLSTLKRKLPPHFYESLICRLLYPQHDPGPDCTWERLFASAPLSYYESFPGTPFHTRFGPVFYRGRLDGSARVLVIGQDPASDETLAMRTFVGQAGQLAQSFLMKLGVTRSYVMFNSFLYGAQSNLLNTNLTSDATITAYRNRLFDKASATSPLTAILAFGSHANRSALAWAGRGNLPIVHLMHPTAQSDVASDWNSHFAQARAAITPEQGQQVDNTPFTSPILATDIPRRDLPFGIPQWHGTSGRTQSKRGSSAAFETQILWTSP